MRVTNSMLTSKYLNNLNRNMGKQDQLLNQMANNRRVAHYSDDPMAFVYSQAARQKLNRLSGYQNMVKTAQDWTVQVENGVMEVNKLLVSAYESCLDAATEIKSGGDKANVSQYTKQLRDQLLQTLNTAFGDKFVFGGYNTVGYTEGGKVVAPFTISADGNLMYNGCDLTDPANATMIEELSEHVISLDVGPGISMPITINGIKLAMIEPPIEITVPKRENGEVVFEQVPVLDSNGDPMTTTEYVRVGVELDADGNTVYDDKGEPVPKYEYQEVPVMKSVYVEGETREINNIYNLVDELYQAIERGDPVESLDQYITPLQSAQRQMLSFTAELGGRTNRLDMLETRYANDEISYTQMKSDAEDADQAELIMNYKMAESIYKAALAVGSYVVKPTLMDFLR